MLDRCTSWRAAFKDSQSVSCLVRLRAMWRPAQTEPQHGSLGKWLIPFRLWHQIWVEIPGRSHTCIAILQEDASSRSLRRAFPVASSGLRHGSIRLCRKTPNGIPCLGLKARQRCRARQAGSRMWSGGNRCRVRRSQGARV